MRRQRGVLRYLMNRSPVLNAKEHCAVFGLWDEDFGTDGYGTWLPVDRSPVLKTAMR